ncbi:MAG: ATPase, T2SS/T4P/T4SS family [Nanoarchaeota archaeon]
MVVTDKYNYYSGNIPVTITIEQNKNDFVMLYKVSIVAISENTEILLNKIRDELILKAGIKIDDILDTKRSSYVKGKFKENVNYLLSRYLPDLGEKTKDFLITYLMQKSLGLGKIELLLDDKNLEEIVVNNSSEPLWVYHHKHGWLKTNVSLENEDQIKHYAALIGRKVGRNITVLTPLLDAHLETGERINATLSPISTKGNTLTLRKFNAKPITITNMLQEKTISLPAASLIWAGMEYELSALVAGGTATGKCLTGETKILLGTGELKQIKDVVEDELENANFKASGGYYGIPKNLEILSINKDNKIVKSKVNYVWKKKADKILKIVTRDGKEVKTTPEHPFFTIDNGEIKEIRADKLEPRTRIACARRLPSLDHNNKINIAASLKESKIAYVLVKDIFNDEDVKKIKKLSKFRWKKSISLYKLNKIIKECNLDHKKIFSKIEYAVAKTNHKKRVYLPKEITAELAEILGYIIGDGHINKSGSTIRFTNIDEHLREKINKNFSKVFGVNGFYHKDKNKAPEIHLLSSVTAEILNKYFDIPRGKKEKIVKVPEIIFRGDKKIIKHFLRALFDCEAYVGDYHIEFSSASRELTNQLKHLLLRYDVIANVNKKIVDNEEYYRLMIYSSEAEKFKEINFDLEYKRQNLERIKGKNHKNLDIVPNMSYFLKELFNSSNLSRKQISRLSQVSPRLLRWYSSGDRNPTINTLSKLSCTLENNCDKELLNKLNLIINSDIYWDEVVLIQELDNDKAFVYDLTVDNHNFIIDNGIIAHNTVFLGAMCSFFPPNQRIISVEDTRELVLPKYLHWVPMVTREPNVERRGEITMLDLIINSLRMRPDRIVVGEIRRQREAETLFEAMHTGHSVYSTLHANDTEETLNRLLNPPINIPKSSLPAISMLIIMYRNRRTGIRRVFQISEIKKDSSAKVLMQYDLRQDKIFTINKSERLMPELQIQTGFTPQEINQDLREKSTILSWLVKKNIDGVDDIGKVVATYYTDKNKLFQFIKK